jgi:hypothetical protein
MVEVLLDRARAQEAALSALPQEGDQRIGHASP